MKAVLTAALIAAAATSADAGVTTCTRENGTAYVFGGSWAVEDPAMEGLSTVNYACDEERPQADGLPVTCVRWGEVEAPKKLENGQVDWIATLSYPEEAVRMIRLIDGPRVVKVIGNRTFGTGWIDVYDVTCTETP